MLRSFVLVYFFTLSSFLFANKIKNEKNSFDNTFYRIYYNTVSKNTEKALFSVDSLLKTVKNPREKSKALLLKASVLGKTNKPSFALKYADMASELAINHKYNDLVSWAYYYKGLLYTYPGFYERADIMFEEANNYSLDVKDDDLRGILKTLLLKGKAESQMSKDEFNNAKKILLEAISKFQKGSLNKAEATAILGRLYELLGQCYYELNELDLSLRTYYKAENHLNKWHTQNTIYTGRVYHKMSDIYFDIKEKDSTFKYIMKSLPIAEVSNDLIFKKNINQSLIKFYSRYNNFDVLKVLLKHKDSLEEVIEYNNKLLVDNMDSYPFKDLKTEKTIKEPAENWKTEIIFFALLPLLLLSIFIYKYREKKKRIEKSNQEIKDLKQRQTTNLNELIEAVKTYDSAILMKFQQACPDLYKKLINSHIKLTDSEIILCAMIWLKFTTKEIARYTFVQPKTVQTKKYRLRKKLSLPSGTDLYKWMNDL